MSFGFGVGDFIAFLQLANKVRKEYVDAPEQAKDLSEKLRDITVLLTNIMSDDKNLTAEDKDQLQAVHDSSMDILGKMETMVKSELLCLGC